MANSTILTGTIGPNLTHPNAITVHVRFIESAINAGAGTSTVKVVVKLINNNDAYERHYSYLDGHLGIHVNGVTNRLGPSKVTFDLPGGATVTLATLYFNSVPNGSGSIPISMTGAWPQWPVGHNSVSVSGTLAMTSSVPYVPPVPAPVPPLAPVWPANGNAVGPTGVGTSTYLNWISRENVARSGSPLTSPYDTMTLLVSQASYPSHFNPISLDTDITPFAGGSLPLSNYAIETFWYTSVGKTLPSQPVYATNIAAGNLIVVQPPSNPPSVATGWGLAVARAEGVAGDPAKATIQTSLALPLTQAWVEPVAGPTTNGGLLASTSAADNLSWSQNSAFVIPAPNRANGQVWPTSVIYPTIGGFWYQFHLVVGANGAGYDYQLPLVYYAPGSAPNLGANGSNSAGEANVVYAPMANIAVTAQAHNDLNASASVQPIVAQVIDFAKRDASLTSGTPLTQVNYCADPRAYWITLTTGNTTASPYVAEQNSAGYTSHNAVVPPTQMLYALAALGVGELDRGDTMTFVAANNNTGSQVSHYVYIGGNPDSPNLAAAQPVPVGANSVAVSALAWINSANAAPGRTVTPFGGIRFTALYANGVTAGTNTVAVAAMGVNSLQQLSASWALPANSNAVTAALVANTAAGASWNGGYQAGDSITTTGFMVLYANANAVQANVPYFDGGFPDIATYAIHSSADLAVMDLASISTLREGHAAGVP